MAIFNSNSIIESVNGIKVNRNYIHTTNCNVRSSRDVKYVVMHYTGNTKDNAINNVKYYKSAGYIGASAQLFVDDYYIYQSVDLKNIAWHCGAKTYYHSECRNSNSIGIEMCCTAGNYRISPTTIKNAAHLCAYLCRMIGITASTVDKYVVRHYDVTHKSCPAQMAGANNQEWIQFKNTVKNILSVGTDVSISSNVAMVGVATTNLNIRSSYGANSDIVDMYKEGETVCVVSCYNNGWYKVARKGYYGYVSGTYVDIKSHHWCCSYLADFVNKGYIENPEVWSDFDASVTKSIAMALIDKMTGGTRVASDNWIEGTIESLYIKGILADKELWMSSPDKPITNALLLALIDKATGGMKELYVGRTTDHWGRNCLDSLCDKGIVHTPEAWTNFEGNVKRCNYMSLCNNAFLRYV